MKPARFVPFSFASFLALLPLSGHGATITENFESSSAGSTTPPSGWTLVTTDPGDAYATSAAGGGSDGSGGSGGSSGLAGTVSAITVTDTDFPGAYLYNSTTFDLSANLSGSFDFQIVHEASFDDVVFLVGDMSGGLTQTNGQSLLIKMAEAQSGGVASTINAGSGATANRLVSTGTLLVDDTWYRASFSWTPTSGITGDFSITVNNFTSDVYTLTTTGYTFNSAEAQIGFGSVNDTIKFDNVSVTGAAIPEPTTTLLGLAGLGLLFRRRR